MTSLHPKIQALRINARPVNYRSVLIKNVPLNKRMAKADPNKDPADNPAYFCIWGVKDSYGTGFVRGVFSKSIRERGPKAAGSQKIVICWQHEISDPIGRPAEIVEDEVGAYVVIDWDDPNDVPSTKRAISQINSGTINQWSFGFDFVWDKMEYDELTDTVWVKEVELYEISPVTIASISETKTVRSKADYESAKFRLDDETDLILRQLPRSKQLELRQLLTKHISLAKIKPDELDLKVSKKPLEKRKPKLSLISRLNQQLK